MRYALYERVSTEEQDLSGQDRDLRAMVASKGGEVAAVYAEKVSGTGRVSRDAYERLLRDVADPARGWDTLAVWALDRFSREERFDMAVGRVLDLEKAGVRFIFLKDPYLSTPDSSDAYSTFARNVLLALLSNVATFEASRHAERTRVAMRELRAGTRRTRSGRPVGRPRRVTEEKVKSILSFRARGLPWADVARRVGLPEGTCSAVGSKARRGALTIVRPTNGGAPRSGGGASEEPTPSEGGAGGVGR